MTEKQWAACKIVSNMLPLLGRKASQRELRLFTAACCRRAWHHLTDERSRRAVEVAERFADGQATTEELSAAHESAGKVATRSAGTAAWDPTAAAWYATESRGRPNWWSAHLATEAAARHGGQKAKTGERKAQAALLRCIIGNPFRPICIAPAWQTPPVVALARAAYDQRELPAGTLDLARLAVLADALEDAGCDQADLLAHLRGPCPHVRGCWAVDLILGKE
jgi:hypothetical protein